MNSTELNPQVFFRVCTSICDSLVFDCLLVFFWGAIFCLPIYSLDLVGGVVVFGFFEKELKVWRVGSGR